MFVLVRKLEVDAAAKHGDTAGRQTRHASRCTAGTRCVTFVGGNNNQPL